MATTTVSNINFGGNGSSGNFQFHQEDIDDIFNQPADGIQSVNVITRVVTTAISKTGSDENIQSGTHLTVLIGVNQNGEQLRADDNLVALPCPPYCEKE